MITIDDGYLSEQVAGLMNKYAEFPQKVASIALRGAMTRAAKGGVSTVRSLTPGGGGRGRRKQGEKRSTGAMRKSVTTKSKVRKGTAYGVLGYKMSGQDRKPIWHEFGTKNGVKAKHMMERAWNIYMPTARGLIVQELTDGLANAARILKNKPELANYRRKPKRK